MGVGFYMKGGGGLSAGKMKGVGVVKIYVVYKSVLQKLSIKVGIGCAE
jgi:hypothetical protein